MLEQEPLAGEEAELEEEVLLTEEPEFEPEPETPPEPRPRPVPVPKPKPAPVLEPASAPELAPPLEPEFISEPEPEPEPEPVPEPEPAPESPPKPPPELLLEPTAGPISVTADQLNSIFHADRAGANAKLMGQTLEVTGIVNKIFVKEHLNIQYIILTGTGNQANWSIRCTFGREHVSQLTRLTVEQTVTVQGKYAGYERNIILKDCALVR